MSFLSKLQVEGKQYNVLEFNMNLNQDTVAEKLTSGNAKFSNNWISFRLNFKNK